MCACVDGRDEVGGMCACVGGRDVCIVGGRDVCMCRWEDVLVQLGMWSEHVCYVHYALQV